MKLKSIQYKEYDGQDNEWWLEDCLLSDVNLMVGKNATGKTRTLNIILALTSFLAGDLKPDFDSSSLEAIFEDHDKEIKYILHCENQTVIQEQLIQDSQTILQRGSDGKGKIFAYELNTEINFQPPTNELAVVTRRDAIQHPFLEKLYNWGQSARYFRFGTPMGQDHLAISDWWEKELNLKNSNQAVAIFKKGESEYGNEYVQLIIEDMRNIGYELEELFLQEAEGRVHFEVPRIIYGINLKEKSLDTITSHHNISTGMFRVLSLFIQLNYSLLASLPSCIIIDDIGEGLDYSRSLALIESLIKKMKGTKMQIIMSTNDRFVMNALPLEYWSVIQRFPHKSMIYNYFNSKNLFDKFELTGLSNFDFFSSNYFLKKS
jgi:ABC-type dipeptide/oligopeptide/nickel transport system ATPase component